MGDLDREPGLADTARARQCQEANIAAPEQRRNPRHFVLTSNQRRQRKRERGKSESDDRGWRRQQGCPTRCETPLPGRMSMRFLSGCVKMSGRFTFAVQAGEGVHHASPMGAYYS